MKKLLFVLAILFTPTLYAQQAQIRVYNDTIHKYKSNAVHFPDNNWFGPGGGSQSGGGGSGSSFKLKVQNQPYILDSVTLIPSSGISITQSGHNVTFAVSIDSHFVKLKIDTLETYLIRYFQPGTFGGLTQYETQIDTNERLRFVRVYGAGAFTNKFCDVSVEENKVFPRDDPIGFVNGGFLWHDCDTVQLGMSGTGYLPPSTWPAGAFYFAEIDLQILDLTDSTWKNLGQYYIQNQLPVPVYFTLPPFLLMKLVKSSPGYTIDYFRPEYYGYSFGQTVSFRMRKFTGLDASVVFETSFKGMTAMACQWGANAEKIFPVYFDSAKVRCDGVIANGPIIGTTLEAILANISAMLTVGDSVHRQGGVITLVDTSGKSSTLSSGATIPRRFVLPDTSVHEHNTSATLVTEERLLALTNALKSYVANPAERPPDTANAFNDEFNTANGSVPDTTSHWTWDLRGPKSSVRIMNGQCILIDTGSTGTNSWRMLDRTETDTVWTITARISPMNSGNYSHIGIIMYNTSNGRLMSWGTSADNTSSHYIVLNKYTSVSTYFTQPYIVAVPNVFPPYYFRLRKDAAKNFYADLSSDGLNNWCTIWSEAGATFIENSGVVNKLGIGVRANANNVVAKGIFWWIRKNWTATWDASVDN